MSGVVKLLQEAAEAVAQTVVGGVIMGLGIAGIMWEKKNPPAHDAHLLAWLVVALLGACIIPSIGPKLIGALTKLVNLVLLILPSRPAPPKDGQ
jgi:hypothetical protein